MFPFLAVLLCTMGGLVVLLVVMSHVSRQMAQNRAEAAREAQAQLPVDEQAAEQLAAAERRMQQLAELEQRAKQQLADDQNRIAHFEQQIRKLQDRIALTAITMQELADDESNHYDDRAQAERELARLQQLITDTQQDIALQKQELEGKERSYAVVPYQGANGTRRRPIYIECRADRVILQPEGVVLKASDFRKPLGVGNPLAAALRAAREHLLRDNPDAAFDADAQPYPLILVRPEGIVAYYIVRDAISSWDSDFGYELLDADSNLAFPTPDAQLAKIEQDAIDNARIRRQALAQAAPTAFASSGGSFTLDEGGEGAADDYNPYDPVAFGAGANSSGGSTPGGTAHHAAQPGSGGDGLAADANQGSLALGGPGRRGQSGEFQQGEFAQGSLGDFASTGQPSGTNSPGSKTSDNASLAASGGSGSASKSGANSAGGNRAMGGGSPGLSAATGQQNGQGSMASLNNQTSPDDVAIRRNVSVDVFADRVLIRASGKSVAMQGPTQQHAGDFVAAVRGQIDSWGLAGQGLYWRPVIKLQPRLGGDQRAAELEAMLRNSGVDVQPLRAALRESEEMPRATR